MPQVFQHSFRFEGDAFGLFCVFKDQPQAFFLDSSLHRSESRFSYIGFAPFTTVRGKDLSGVKKVFARYRLPRHRLAFPAGAVGYLAYDGSLFFGFYDTILTVDHDQKHLIISGFSKNKIQNILAQVRDVIARSPRLKHSEVNSATKQSILSSRRMPGSFNPHFQSNFSKSEYIHAVRQALEHIRQGDIYQINLSHRVQVQWPQGVLPPHAVDIYRHLRQAFPSEFGAYFHDGQQAILSASPERFLKLHNGIAQVKPMKGTRPRGKTPAEDKRSKAQLQKSPKEIAELLMVTDLERNDLGRVCDYASVVVKAMRTIETYKSVFQATSTIEGRLRRDRDQFDLLEVAFPSGSVTGCPKIMAMKIIKKLEGGSRGLYTGALGYMSFSGDMDFNVMIRTMFVAKDRITFHVGGGIVADSKPQDEWDETWIKARPLIETLKKCTSSTSTANTLR